MLAVETGDGSPHAATVHFAHTENPFVFFFETAQDSKKGQSILSKKETRASVVLGTIESTMMTLQMDGLIQVLGDNEKELYDKIYLGKFPEKEGKFKDQKIFPFIFTPNWWRFTDWTKPGGKQIINSDQK